MGFSWKLVFGLCAQEGKSLLLLSNQNVPKRWKDCCSSSNGNILTNQISIWPRSTSHCHVDINVILRIPACSRRPGDSLFDKGLHVLHGEKQTNHLDVRRDDWGVIPREGRSTCNRKYFGIAVKLPSQQTPSEEERKEHVIRQLRWNWRQPNLRR